MFYRSILQAKTLTVAYLATVIMLSVLRVQMEKRSRSETGSAGVRQRSTAEIRFSCTLSPSSLLSVVHCISCSLTFFHV